MKKFIVKLARALVVVSVFVSVSFSVSSALAEAWKFGVMCDTQWPNSPDMKNPNSVAINVINHLNQKFIDHGVKFVVAVGDVTDNGSILALDTRATFAQALYNSGIGFYPLRGNHESSKTAAVEFQRIFPQTRTGMNNQTPVDALVTTTYYGAPPLNTKGTFTVGSNFASYPAANNGYNGLFYSFDYDNARFVLMDQFTPTDGASHSVLDSSQVNWVDMQLQNRAEKTHAFVFGHKHLISENHVDTLFGSNPSVNPDLQNIFMASLFTNGVRYYMGGHDHMHNRAIVTSPSGVSTVQNIIAASDSYKFYIPQIPSNDTKYDNPAREMEISQELFTVGYYIVTIDGPRVTVDYYASPNGCSGDCDETYDVIPYTFTKHETFGYSLNGKEFLIAQGQSYTAVQDSFSDTTARILDGSNGSTAADYAGRAFTKAVDTGWTAKTVVTPKTDTDTASDILSLWGMADLGRSDTDVFTLSLSYDAAKSRPKHLGQGLFGLATRGADGKWANAVDKNIGGSRKFIMGPWQPGYELGAYGVDPSTKTAWAVINYNADFAVARFSR